MSSSSLKQSFILILHLLICIQKLDNRLQVQIRMKPLLCRQHKNPGEIICLVDQCQSRLMCMLCEHNHQFFTSIRSRKQVQLKRFKKGVDESIDRSLKIIDRVEEGGIEQQKKMIVNYYTTIKEDLNRFLDLRMNQTLSLLKNLQNSSLQSLIRARIQGTYESLPMDQFIKIRQVYEGKDLETIAHQQQQRNVELAYTYMEEFHKQFTDFLTKFKIEIKIRLPQIRIKSEAIKASYKNNVEDYNQNIYRPQQKQSIKFITNVQIPMLITDAYSGTKEIFTIGWDKVLRVFDKQLKLICQKQFPNVLTRFEKIGQSIFAMGVSKQLHINKISFQEAYDPKHIMILKGHTQRITDISSFNTRIIASSSEQGTKIWDLYKQKCQYTLREEVNPSCIKFMPSINNLAVGYHNHVLKIYSVNKMKPVRLYQLPGVPLCLSQENRNENLLYCSGFGSDLRLFDFRITKEVFSFDFKSQAITTFKQSIFDEETLLVGDRKGKAQIFDLRKLKKRLEWQAHEKMTNLSKPNGVVKIYQQSCNQILTVGANDHRALIWQLKNKD